MLITLNGQIWTIQYVRVELTHGFEVHHRARLIRVAFTDVPEEFGRRVALAVAGALAIPVFVVTTD